MRFVSQFTAYGVQIRPQRQQPLGDGTINITQQPIYVAFTPVEKGGFLFDNEKATAERHFNFPGLTQHEDEATPSDPDYRLSVFDSDEAAEREGWSAEEKTLVEETLLRKSRTTPQNLILIESTPIEAPFPAYDTYEGDAEQLVLKLVEDGHELDRVLHYERTFGRKRPEVIEALEIGVEALAATLVSS